MSYGVSAALQAAIYQRVSTDAAVQALVGSAVYDAVPAGALPATYVTLGPEAVKDASDTDGRGAWHDVVLSVITSAAGFQEAKDVAAALNDALLGANLTLTRGRVVGVAFKSAKAKREGTGSTRRIDMSFRLRVEDTV